MWPTVWDVSCHSCEVLGLGRFLDCCPSRYLLTTLRIWLRASCLAGPLLCFRGRGGTENKAGFQILLESFVSIVAMRKALKNTADHFLHQISVVLHHDRPGGHFVVVVAKDENSFFDPVEICGAKPLKTFWKILHLSCAQDLDFSYSMKRIIQRLAWVGWLLWIAQSILITKFDCGRRTSRKYMPRSAGGSLLKGWLKTRYGLGAWKMTYVLLKDSVAFKSPTAAGDSRRANEPKQLPAVANANLSQFDFTVVELAKLLEGLKDSQGSLLEGPVCVFPLGPVALLLSWSDI